MDGKNRDFPTEIDWPSVSSINSLEDQMLDDYSDEWTEEEEEETVFETNDARIEEDPVLLTNEASNHREDVETDFPEATPDEKLVLKPEEKKEEEEEEEEEGMQVCGDPEASSKVLREMGLLTTSGGDLMMTNEMQCPSAVIQINNSIERANNNPFDDSTSIDDSDEKEREAERGTDDENTRLESGENSGLSVIPRRDRNQSSRTTLGKLRRKFWIILFVMVSSAIGTFLIALALGGVDLTSVIGATDDNGFPLIYSNSTGKIQKLDIDFIWKTAKQI